MSDTYDVAVVGATGVVGEAHVRNSCRAEISGRKDLRPCERDVRRQDRSVRNEDLDVKISPNSTFNRRRSVCFRQAHLYRKSLRQRLRRPVVSSSIIRPAFATTTTSRWSFRRSTRKRSRITSNRALSPTRIVLPSRCWSR